MTDMSVEITTEIEDLALGCTFMGTGGGGSLQEGLRLLRMTIQEGKPIRLVPPDSVSDRAWICTGSYVGSIAPRSEEDLQMMKRLGLERRINREIVRAVKELEHYTGQVIAAIAPCELGGLNTAAPLDAAARLNIPAIDGDFAGRALPETIQFRFCIDGIKIWPRVFCDYAGNVSIVKEAITPPMMERIQKHLAMASLGLVGAAGHLMSGKEMKRVIIPGTVSRCITLGAAIRRARETETKNYFAQKLAEAVTGWVLFQGIVVQKVWENTDGYMIGHIELHGEMGFEGRIFRVWFKNECHVSWIDGEPFVTSPDIISIVNLETGDAPTNTDIARGDRLAFIGQRAPEGYRSSKALQVLSPSHFGFDIPYVPIEERIESP